MTAGATRVVLTGFMATGKTIVGRRLAAALRWRFLDTDAAHAHLVKRDRKLARWMKKLGPIEADARWRKPFDPVDALARAILYQQLSGKAAATIVGRVEAVSSRAEGPGPLLFYRGKYCQLHAPPEAS